jgi:PAS domain S-box-containing protein
MKDESKTKKRDFSEEKYSHLIENINAGIYRNTPGPKGKFIEANPAIVKMFGYKSKKDFLKINVSDLYQNPEDRKIFNQKMQRDKCVKNEGLKLKKKNGSTLWGSVSAVAVTDKKGKIRHYDGAILDITEQKKMEQELKEKEAFNFALFQYSPQNSVVVDHEGKIIKTNIKKRKSGSRIPNLGDVMYRDYASKHKIDMYGELIKCIKSGKTKKFPECKYGKKILAIIIAPFNDGAIIASQDITEHKKADEKIEKSLKEKTVLLQEIHHRVKNNLQIVASLLNLQSRRIKDKESLEMLQATRKRVFSMALVHERLYRSENFARIDFCKYIEEMTVHLLSFHRDKMEKVRYEKDIKKTIIDINKAVPLGLILNELITNALKHAFPKDREGKIKIKFNKKGSRYNLIISDDGIGFPKDLDFRKAESMGLTLITSLVNQIDGEIKLDRSKGTSFKIRFKE